MPLSAEELATLVESIQSLGPEVRHLQEEMRGDRSSREEETVSRDLQTRKLRLLTVVAVIAASLGLLVGAIGIFQARDARKAADQAQNAIDAVTQARNEARVVACQSDNDHVTGTNNLVVAMEGVIALVNAPNPDRTPEQQTQIDKFIQDSIAELETAREDLRDCSPEGIDAYYNH